MLVQQCSNQQLSMEIHLGRFKRCLRWMLQAYLLKDPAFVKFVENSIAKQFEVNKGATKASIKSNNTTKNYEYQKTKFKKIEINIDNTSKGHTSIHYNRMVKYSVEKINIWTMYIQEDSDERDWNNACLEAQTQTLNIRFR